MQTVLERANFVAQERGEKETPALNKSVHLQSPPNSSKSTLAHCYIVNQNRSFLFLDYPDRTELYYRGDIVPIYIRTDYKIKK